MINLSEEARKHGFGLIAALIPEFYAATTIDDFLRDKKTVRPTPITRIFPALSHEYGFACISFRNSVIFKRTAKDEGNISDLTASIGVILNDGLKIEDGTRLYEAEILYDPICDVKFLSEYKTEGPKMPQSGKSKSLPNLEGAVSPA